MRCKTSLVIFVSILFLPYGPWAVGYRVWFHLYVCSWGSISLSVNSQTGTCLRQPLAATCASSPYAPVDPLPPFSSLLCAPGSWPRRTDSKGSLVLWLPVGFGQWEETSAGNGSWENSALFLKGPRTSSSQLKTTFSYQTFSPCSYPLQVLETNHSLLLTFTRGGWLQEQQPSLVVFPRTLKPFVPLLNFPQLPSMSMPSPLLRHPNWYHRVKGDFLTWVLKLFCIFQTFPNDHVLHLSC